MTQGCTFTTTEYAAFNALFDAIAEVDGEHRLVDPFGKAEGILGSTQAGALVEKLKTNGLLTFLFPGREAADEESRGTHRAKLEAWVDLAPRIKLVPDPPFTTEERRIVVALAEISSRSEALVAKRVRLEEELRQVKEDIRRNEKGVVETEKALADFREWRSRILSIEMLAGNRLEE